MEPRAWTSEEKSRNGHNINVDLEVIFKGVDVGEIIQIKLYMTAIKI